MTTDDTIKIDRTRLGYIMTGILILAVLSYGMTPPAMQEPQTMTTAIIHADAILSHIHLDNLK